MSALPKLSKTPRFCVTIGGAGWLRLGVFTTAHEARRAIGEYQLQHPWMRPEQFAVEHIYLSVRPK